LRRIPCLVALLLALAACGDHTQQNDEIPTQANIEALATAQILTQNAPPPGFRDALSYPEVDKNLNALPGWRYVVRLEFDGTFTGTSRATTANANAEIWFNQLGSARRVVVSTAGELLGREDAASYEAVRLGPDAFLVEDNTCLSNAGADADTAADLTAGQLVGGVKRAVPAGRHATVNGEDVYLYSFTNEDLNLPSIQLEDGGTINANGEFWVNPEHGVVVRFYAILDVTNARVFGRTLPVDGRINMQYDLYDIGTAFNITQPFGC
jgi:hypothetical protein